MKQWSVDVCTFNQEKNKDRVLNDVLLQHLSVNTCTYNAEKNKDYVWMMELLKQWPVDVCTYNQERKKNGLRFKWYNCWNSDQSMYTHTIKEK